MILSLLRRVTGREPAPSSSAVPSSQDVDGQLGDARALAAAGEYAAALAIWGPLAHAGVGRAAANIGACFLDGLGVDRDPALALRWLEVAAEAGDPVGQRNFATALFQGIGGSDRPADALHWYRKAAENGDPQAQDMLSWMLLEGEIAPYDAEAARSWAERAAEAGIGAAMTRMGLIHHNALGVERGAEAAAGWWARAVAAGDADGAAMLGAAHLLGQGIDRDPVRAAVLIELARLTGSGLAETYRPAAEAGLDPESRARALVIAEEIAAAPPWNRGSAP